MAGYTEGGAEVAWNAAGARPYLMLDQGLVDAAGTPIHTPIAADVEDLQLAYVYPLAAAAAQVRGATENTQLTNTAAGIDLAPSTIPSIPLYSTERLAVARTSGHPSNVRAVRVAVVIRSAEALDPADAGVVPASGNRPAVDSRRGYRRSLFQTSIGVPNLESRGPVFPAWGDPKDPDNQLNVGGG
ncbi:MAG: PilW family protein [Anaeromyxobacter sp.]